MVSPPPFPFFFSFLCINKRGRWKRTEKQSWRVFSPTKPSFAQDSSSSQDAGTSQSLFNLEAFFSLTFWRPCVAFPPHLLVESGSAAFSSIVLFGINIWLETTKQFSASASRHSLILSPFRLFSFVHTTHMRHPPPPITRKEKDRRWQFRLLLMFIPNIAWKHSDLPSHCPLAGWSGFTRQTVFEKDTSTAVSQSGERRCRGMDEKERPRHGFTALEKKLKKHLKIMV